MSKQETATVGLFQSFFGLFQFWQDLSLKRKLQLFSVIFILALLAGIHYLEKCSQLRIHCQIESAMLESAEIEAKKASNGLFELCRIQNDRLLIHLSGKMAALKEMLTKSGKVRNLPDKIEWQATHHSNGEKRPISAPILMFGEATAEKMLSEKTGLAFRNNEIAPTEYNILQRINNQGDLLIIASNQGKERVGLFIEANGILSALINDERYSGFFLMKNQPNLAIFEPLKDESGNIVGALQVCVSLDSLNWIKEVFEKTGPGKNGFAFAVGINGDELKSVAHPHISSSELVEEAKGEHHKIIVKIAAKVKEADDGQNFFERLSVSKGEKNVQLAAFTFFKPWNWLIGVQAAESDLLQALPKIGEELSSIRKMLIGVIAVLLMVACGMVLFVAYGIIDPIDKSTDILRILAVEGDTTMTLDQTLTKRKDEIGDLARSTNSLAKQQKIVAGIMSDIANGKWIQDIRVKSDKDLFGKSLAQMVKEVNFALGSVKMASAEVKNSSEQIASASQSISQGAAETASSTEEIFASINEIARQTQSNAENAIQANNLADLTKNSAETGFSRMSDMMGAMQAIQRSSTDIAKIIKVIDDIAFQTNLLSLNAAVEAARAGKHGKGFAVVADEVRNLATRSAKAAKETSEMIESSIAKVKTGNEIARMTETALQEIVSNSIKVADLVGEIAAAGNEQAQGISQIVRGLEQIDKITQQNTSNSEETAETADGLSVRARQLHSIMSKFTVRTDDIKLDETTKTEQKKETERKVKKASETKPDLQMQVKPASMAGKQLPPKKNPAQIIALDDEEFGRY
ncbi:MAG: methyl-accepting chemotaxis protein [Candidatus Rifleibacteriota bacterium]